MKLINDIQKTATSDLITAQNEAWRSLVCDGYDTATRVQLCSVEKELKKRITSSVLMPITTPLSLDGVIKGWESVSTEDDKRVVGKIADEIKSHLSAANAPQDFAANAPQDFAGICDTVSSKLEHEIYCDDVEVALAKLVSNGEVKRDGNQYQRAPEE